MAEIHYPKVPLIPQRRSMSCWYAAACMIGQYYEVGPRFGVPGVWVADEGLNINDIDVLARNENLVVLPLAHHDFSAESLIATLTHWGPLLCSHNWLGNGHTVALTGCTTHGSDGESVYFNDPEPMNVGTRGANVSIKTFNEHRLRGLLLARDPASIP